MKFLLPTLTLFGFVLPTIAHPSPPWQSPHVSSNLSRRQLYGAHSKLAARADAVTQPDVGQYILDPKFKITATPQIREYHLIVKDGEASPDGVSKTVYAYNGTMPGPVIEANTGDTLRITIDNQSDRNHLTHFHGIPQVGTNWADGLPGLTNCPLAPGVKQTFEFKAPEEFGTYWGHSHVALGYTEGQVFPIVIHSPDDPYKRGTDFDEEVVIVLQDWYHTPASVFEKQLLSVDGYNNSIAAPPHDSILINGRGRFTNATFDSNVPWPQLALKPSTRYRFRFIGALSHAQIRVSLDTYNLDLIAVDATPVVKKSLKRLHVNGGQRADAIWKSPSKGQLWLRAEAQTQCYAYTDGSLPFGLLAVKILNANGTVPTGSPTTSTTADTGPAACLDLPDSDLVPVKRIGAYKVEGGPAAVFTNNFGVINATTGGSGSIGAPGQLVNDTVNGVSAQLPIWYPPIQAMEDGKTPVITYATQTFDDKYATYATQTFDDKYAVGDIIWNNLDRTQHPVHVHGNTFQIIARGNGTMTNSKWQTLRTSSQYALANPHINFHALSGFLGAMV
ncbi:Multicopper oxidases [Ceraceosorus bombacis]|uniref:Multicopper oxidases n=1 Tax=Ceraceosorus bombacis TaxID=401625 RepID=A0A0P1BKP9_9BASI|nr:Multicopper oxidases [Ceraceosorus bombacis]